VKQNHLIIQWRAIEQYASAFLTMTFDLLLLKSNLCPQVHESHKSCEIPKSN